MMCAPFKISPIFFSNNILRETGMQTQYIFLEMTQILRWDISSRTHHTMDEKNHRFCHISSHFWEKKTTLKGDHIISELFSGICFFLNLSHREPIRVQWSHVDTKVRKTRPKACFQRWTILLSSFITSIVSQHNRGVHRKNTTQHTNMDSLPRLSCIEFLSKFFDLTIFGK